MSEEDFFTRVDPLLDSILDGRYKVVRKLGEGGMGAVYEGLHTLIKRRVAIKTLHPHIASHPEALQRFRREAMAATATGSPHVVECTDLGATPGGQLYMVLEFLEGRDLAAEIDETGPMPVGRAVRILCQVCDALEAVHAKGIVHRDLKPENLFLVRRPGGDDFIKVLDFGISKFNVSPDGNNTRMTGEGIAMGTAHFMSPEQAEGRLDLDHRTDIYALGGILYQMLTGVTPFEAETFAMLVMKVFTEPAPAVKARRTDVPQAVQDVVARCLAKRPEERLQTVAEVKRALWPHRGVDEEPTFSESPPAPAVGHMPTLASQAPPMPLADTMASVPPSAAVTGAAEVVVPQPPPAQTAPEVQATRGLSWLTLTLAAVPIVGALVFAGLQLSSDSEDSAPTGEAAPMAAPAPAPAPPEPEMPAALPEPAAPAAEVQTVRLRASTRPSEAQLFLDEVPVDNPLDLQVEQDGDPHLLEARLEGYEPRSEPLTFDSDLAVRLTLEKRRSARAPRRPVARAPAAVQVAPPPVETPAPAQPPAPSANEPKDESGLKRVRF